MTEVLKKRIKKLSKLCYLCMQSSTENRIKTNSKPATNPVMLPIMKSDEKVIMQGSSRLLFFILPGIKNIYSKNRLKNSCKTARIYDIICAAMPPARKEMKKLPSQIIRAEKKLLSLNRIISEAMHGTNNVITMRATAV